MNDTTNKTDMMAKIMDGLVYGPEGATGAPLPERQPTSTQDEVVDWKTENNLSIICFDGGI